MGQAIPQESFRACAIRYSGETYTGATHPTIFIELEDRFPGIRASDCLEGFITTTGRFPNRVEAKILADELGIVRPGRDKFINPELHSEYLVFGSLPARDGAPR